MNHSLNNTSQEIDEILLKVFRPHPNLQPEDYLFLSDAKIIEAKQRIQELIVKERIDEYKKHFIPHQQNQLETVFYLPGKRLSVWGTTSAREAYNHHLAELEAQLTTNKEAK